MSKTTIQLTESTKELLDDHKQGQESYNDVVRRLADTGTGQIWTGDELTMDIEGEMDGVGDKTLTVKVTAVNDGNDSYTVEAGGKELGYLKLNEFETVDNDGLLTTQAGVTIAKCYNIEVQ